MLLLQTVDKVVHKNKLLKSLQLKALAGDKESFKEAQRLWRRFFLPKYAGQAIAACFRGFMACVSFFAIMKLAARPEFLKKSFFFIPCLIGPQYDMGVGFGWMFH